MKKNEYLKQLLQIHWLRPETALWRAFDCMLMEKYGKISGRSVDLGCGDGTMSYLMAGGKINNYDVFMDVGDLGNYNSGADIHNQNTELALNIDSNSLRYRFEWGVDHKAGLISKAKRFDSFYKNTKVIDLNETLPYEDGFFDTAFSNILYWMNDVNATLAEINRVLNSSGKLFLFLPNLNFKEKAWLYYSAPHKDERKYFNYFDRGYNSLIHHCYGSAEWEKIFKDNGFVVKEHQLYLSNPVMDIWNIGTRPIAPLLIDMASKLPKESRDASKLEWVKYFEDFLNPILEGEFGKEIQDKNGAFHFFSLEKI